MAGSKRSDTHQSDKERLKSRGYQIGKTLGEGTYAKVREGMWRGDDKNVRIAIKIINRKTLPKNMRNKFLPRELDIIAQIKHDNIIKTFEIIHINAMTYITMECARRGDLLDFIHAQGILSENVAREMFLQIMNGLNYLHNKNIVHRDLKCENILVGSDQTLKLADFGFAREFSDSDFSETFCGSPAYAAPEIIQGIPYNCKISDGWSCGVILFTMTIGCMPYRDHNLRTLLIDQKAPLDIPRSVLDTISEHLIDYLKRNLMFDHEKRLPVSFLMKHEWLKGEIGNRNNGVFDQCFYDRWYFDSFKVYDRARKKHRPLQVDSLIEESQTIDSLERSEAIRDARNAAGMNEARISEAEINESEKFQSAKTGSKTIEPNIEPNVEPNIESATIEPAKIESEKIEMANSQPLRESQPIPLQTSSFHSDDLQTIESVEMMSIGSNDTSQTNGEPKLD